jgi:C4-dicarboxylate-specific signal transduction histidine kinase
MASEGEPPTASVIPDDALLLLNRATLVVHTVRTAVHELNNVLQMISGSAELLASAGVPAAASARINTILQQTGRGHDILQAIDDLARRDRPAGQESRTAVADVAAVADRALQLRRYEHRRAAIGATLHRPATGPIRARIDPQQLLQAILNLLVNAEQSLAGGRDGAIQISLWSDDRYVDVSVADNGPGLDADLDLIAPFVTTRGQAAAGLGLAATRLIASQAGGTLEAISGDGARWRLRLPVVPTAS